MLRRVGGLPDIPLMEDFAFVSAARRYALRHGGGQCRGVRPVVGPLAAAAARGGGVRGDRSGHVGVCLVLRIWGQKENNYHRRLWLKDN